MNRFYIEGLIMGLGIGFATLLLNWWVGDANWPPRLLALLVIGGLLCMLQYGLTRIRGKR